ncbi:MAG TPA: S1 RNA-binding domain-containing protein, partial [Zoogloea sp.]|nr:S1 RNA-binding domain-containing protein [Zoogloea sp.]
MTERRADEADRDVENWLKCYYMQDRIGEEFEGSVSAVVPFGLFVALHDVFVEGLVHISDLGSDYFHFDDAQHALVGERTGQRYRLSDQVRVQLVRVNMEASKIDFRLLQGPERVTERVGKTSRTKAARIAPEPAQAVEAAPPAGRRRSAKASQPEVPGEAVESAPSPKAMKDKTKAKAKTSMPRKSAADSTKKKAKPRV